jgi:hypothetical protein
VRRAVVGLVFFMTIPGLAASFDELQAVFHSSDRHPIEQRRADG